MSTSVVDYVRRPPAIAHRLDVFGMHVVDDSMAPWRKPRELVFIEPNQTPMAGDHVVIELLGEHKENGRPALLRALVKASPKSLRLRQYNPAREIEIERRHIAQVYRVWEWSELFAAG